MQGYKRANKNIDAICCEIRRLKINYATRHRKFLLLYLSCVTLYTASIYIPVAG
jgi:hypothetical protein